MRVNVSFKSPKRQSFDFEFWAFWMSSNDWIVERSIIIVPSEGWYLMRREWKAKIKERVSSIYLTA
jgi:hypothetical protein